ncbi:MAG: glutathione S-transferase [Alphaproteobacteria bacterium]|nr:glutathione S-transferase [Alphaproteobacteria bacterium]
MTDTLTLVLGDRTYSSWSLRGWLFMAQSGLPFEEEMFWLDAPDYKDGLRAATGGVGSVPTLRVGTRIVAESMAIAEYAAEAAPDAGLWPTDPLDRAEARSLAARMHAGFTSLRGNCPMNLSNQFPDFKPSDAVLADLRVLESMWEPCLERSGGPFLYGSYGAVDSFFAPVAARIYTFCLPVSDAAQAYADAILTHPLMRQWIAAAAEEPKVDRPRTGRFSEGGYAPGDWPILKG